MDIFLCQLVIQTADPEGTVGSHLGLKALLVLKQQAELPLRAFAFPTLIHGLALVVLQGKVSTFCNGHFLSLGSFHFVETCHQREKERQLLLLCFTAFYQLIITYTLHLYNWLSQN